jgi:hypothetical protein
MAVSWEIGEDYYPLPWSLWSIILGGYEVNISEQQLKNAPKFSTSLDFHGTEST